MLLPCPSRCFVALLPLLLLALPPRAQAQEAAPAVTTTVTVYTPDGETPYLQKDEAICPGDVPIGVEPLKINFKVSTTSVTPVPYTTTFTYTHGTLDGSMTVVDPMDTTPASVTSGDTTMFSVTVNVHAEQAFEVDVVTTAKDDGPAMTRWRVLRGTIQTQHEQCTFNVLPPELRTITISSAPLEGIAINEIINGEAAGTGVTPYIRSLEDGTAVTLEAPPVFDGEPITGWYDGSQVLTDTGRLSFDVNRDRTVTALYGEPTEADVGVRLTDVENGFYGEPVIYLPPISKSTLTFEVYNDGPDGTTASILGSFGTGVTQIETVAVDGEPCGEVSPSFFTCTTTLDAGMAATAHVTLQTFEEGSASASVFTTTDGVGTTDPNGDNNSLSAPIIVVAGGSIHGQKFFDTDQDGIKDPDEIGLNGVVMSLFDENNMLLARDTTHVMDLNGDGFLDPFTEHGLFWFAFLPPGDYAVSEAVLDWTPTTLPTQLVTIDAEEVFLWFGNFTSSEFDWGDLPAPYPTLFPTGASHAILEGLSLGDLVDGETDGLPSANAEGDDRDGSADEDGLDEFEWFHPDSVYIALEVSLPPEISRASLAGWIDFNNDGLLDPFAENIIARTVDTTGTYGFIVPIPPGSTPRYARFRLSTAATGVTGTGALLALTPDGMWFSGEVEDYLLDDYLATDDFGDAPDTMDPNRPDIPSGYPTRRADNGAHHFTEASTIQLGEARDNEADGRPSTEADGDDQNNRFDEDGLLFETGFIPLGVRPEPKARTGQAVRYGIAQGTEGTLRPLASVQGKLDAWVDFNRDGDWDDSGEQIFDSEDVQTGPNYTPLTFTVPPSAAPGFTFARFRFSTNGDLSFDGPAPNGEVEDYLLQILAMNAVTTTADAGDGSLRQLLTDANTVPGIALIDLRGLGKQDATIALQSPLPTLTNPVILLGAGNVILDGTAAGTSDGLTLDADGSVIAGLTLQGFTGDGLVLNGSDNLIQHNTIRDNGGQGIRVLGVANKLLGNRITGNAGLGIDVGGDGATPNDTPDQDGVPNFPLVLAATTTDSTRIEGILAATPATAFVLDFYTNEACAATGEGMTPLGTTTVTTDGTGNAPFTARFAAAVRNGHAVTATATSEALGTSEFSSCAIAVDTQRSPTDLPSALRLHANYPNPFNPTTTLRFDLPEAADVHIDVFDMLGRQVMVHPVGHLPAQTNHTVTLNARALPSGTYLYRLVAQTNTRTHHQTGRFVLIR